MTNADGATGIRHESLRLPDGRSFHIARAGVPGPTILFLHGYVDSWRSFERMFPLLHDHFMLLAPDQRGHGETEAADRYAVADFVSDAITLTERLAGEPVHLVGHSLGAIVAQRVATARPDLVRSMTLIAGAVTARANASLTALAEHLKELSDPIPYAFAYDFQKSTAFQPLSEAVLDCYVRESLKVRAHAWKGALHGLISDPYDPIEPPPTVPALLMWGEHDELFPLSDQKPLRRRLSSSHVLDFPHNGHAPQWEDPERVAIALRTFIEKLSA